MIRFFVSPEEFSGTQCVLTGENARHAKVLRLKAGEEVLLCDGQGMERKCRVENPENLTLSCGAPHPSETEAAARVSVYMAFPKADKLEHVIQKATELGAAEIVAFPSERCVSRPDEKSLKKKLERWLESPEVDEHTKAALRAMKDEEQSDCFYRDLEFGTGGLRGEDGAGDHHGCQQNCYKAHDLVVLFHFHLLQVLLIFSTSILPLLSPITASLLLTS